VITSEPVGDPVDDRDGAAQPQRDGLLDVGEEVARLTEALAGWWASATAGSPASGGPVRQSADPHDDGSDRGADGANHVHHEVPTGESCRVCPLCRALDIARTARPDLLTKVATAAETVALLLREAAAGEHAHGSSGYATGTAGTETEPGAEPHPAPSTRGTPIVVRDLDEAPSDEQPQRGTPWD
jgi:hypothetical protein